MNNGQQSFLMEQQKYIAAIAAQGAAGKYTRHEFRFAEGLDAGLTIMTVVKFLFSFMPMPGFPVASMH